MKKRADERRQRLAGGIRMLFVGILAGLFGLCAAAQSTPWIPWICGAPTIPHYKLCTISFARAIQVSALISFPLRPAATTRGRAIPLIATATPH